MLQSDRVSPPENVARMS